QTSTATRPANPLRPSGQGHRRGAPDPEANVIGDPEVMLDLGVRTDQAGLDTVADVPDRRPAEDDRVLDLRPFQARLGPDRGVRTDERVDDLGVAAYHRRSPDRGPLDPC